jgi:hypothetical protein
MNTTLIAPLTRRLAWRRGAGGLMESTWGLTRGAPHAVLPPPPADLLAAAQAPTPAPRLALGDWGAI